MLDQYDEGAEEHLSAAVKLDPSSITAWNSLGACLWKKGDLQGAENCFESALELVRPPLAPLPFDHPPHDTAPACLPPQRPNAPSLCQLSILLRNKKGPQQQRAESIAVRLARPTPMALPPLPEATLTSLSPHVAAARG